MSHPQSVSPRTRWLLRASVAAVVGTAGVGCDSAKDKADRAVQASFDAAATAPEGKAHADLDTAAGTTGASVSLRARAKGLLADDEIRQANDAARRAAANSADVRQLATDLRGLTDAVAADNQLAAALQKYEPVKPLDALKAQAAQMTGSAATPDWYTSDAGKIASLSATDQAVADLQQQVDALQQQVKSESDQRAEQLSQADRLTQQSRQETGYKSVDLFTQGSTARKQADDLAAKLTQDQSKLARLKQDLAVQQAQQGTIKGAVAAVGTNTAGTNDAWASVQEQIKAIRKHSADLLGEGDAAGPATITAKAAALQKKLAVAKPLRTEADNHFNNATAFYKEANELATQLKTELADERHAGSAAARPDRADLYAWDVQKDAVDPAQYRLLQGMTGLARSQFYARSADEQQAVAMAAQGAEKPFADAGLTVPVALADPGEKAEAAKKERRTAIAGYTDAVALLSKINDGDASPVVKQGAQVGRALAEYGWSLALTAAGDDQAAAGHLAASKAAIETAVANRAVIPRLPSALASALPPTAKPAGGTPTMGGMVPPGGNP